MDISVKKEDIVSALSITLGVVENRHTLPILANVLFEVDENTFKLTATDLESFVTTSGPLTNTQSSGITTTSAKKLNELCRLIPDGEDIRIFLEGEKLNIRTKNGKYSLSILPSADFPIFDIDSGGAPLVIPAQDLRTLITDTSFAIGPAGWKRQLEGVFLSVDGGQIVAATSDGARLAVAKISTTSNNSFSGIIPKKPINEMAKILSDQQGDAELKIYNASLELVVGNLIFKSKLIDANFPDYQRVIPSGESSFLEINVKDFSETLSRVSVLSSEKSRRINLAISSDGIIISTDSLNQGEAEEFFPAKYTGEELEIVFNGTYLQEIMSHLKTDLCHINFFGPDKSCIITPPDSDSPTYLINPLL
jgi:DNA polymerase III subunit beta